MHKISNTDALPNADTNEESTTTTPKAKNSKDEEKTKSVEEENEMAVDEEDGLEIFIAPLLTHPFRAEASN